MGDATMRRNTDTQLVSLPVNAATRERCAGGKTCCNLAHDWSPLGLGTDGSDNLMTLLGETQVGARSRTRAMTARDQDRSSYQGALVATGASSFRARAPVRAWQPATPYSGWRSWLPSPSEVGSDSTGNIEVSISVLPTVFAAAVFGPLGGDDRCRRSRSLATFHSAFCAGAIANRQRRPASQVGRLHMHPSDLRSGCAGLPQRSR